MNILILTRLNWIFLKRNYNDVSEYITYDHFFDGYNNGFKALGCQTFLSWDENFFISPKLKIRFPLIARLLFILIRKTKLYLLDRYLMSKKVARYCEKNSIDLIFTEINNSISPKIIKKNYPKIIVSQWYGVFPEMSNADTLKILSEYDYIWGPAEFKPDKVKFNGIEKLRYIGCSYNERLYYNDVNPEYSYDVIFFGGISKAHKNRISILEKVAENFDNFSFWGYGIENVPNGYKLRDKYKGYIEPKELRKLISSSKIAINIPMIGYDRVLKGFNAKLFEISSCGGALQFVPEDDKLLEFYTPGEELITFKDAEDLIAKIKYYLHNANERKVIVQKAAEKSKKYTYTKRCEKLLRILNSEKVE